MKVLPALLLALFLPASIAAQPAAPATPPVTGADHTPLGAPVKPQPELPALDHLYTSYQGPMEPDKALSIWLLRSRIDPKAKFKFFPRGARIEEGMTFEIPFAKLDRIPGKSLFETLLARVPSPEPALLAVARILHDIEINIWGNKITTEAAGVQVLARGMAAGAKNDEDGVERAMMLGEALYTGLKEVYK